MRLHTNADARSWRLAPLSTLAITGTVQRSFLGSTRTQWSASRSPILNCLASGSIQNLMPFLILVSTTVLTNICCESLLYPNASPVPPREVGILTTQSSETVPMNQRRRISCPALHDMPFGTKVSSSIDSESPKDVVHVSSVHSAPILAVRPAVEMSKGKRKRKEKKDRQQCLSIARIHISVVASTTDIDS